MYLVTGEAFFYQNSISGGDFSPLRYAFVTQLATLLACLIAFVGLVQLGVGRTGPWLLVALGAALVATVPLAARQVELTVTSNRASSVATAARSIATFSQITAGARDTRLSRTAQVVLLVDAPSDYEKAYALPRYLAFYGREAPVYMKVDIASQSDPLSSRLTEELKDMALEGRLTYGWRITPYARLDSSKSTICFYFGRAPVNLKNCASKHQIG
jgi:hypothetical protein